MKKILLWIGLLSLAFTMSSCDELDEGPYTVTFDDETLDSVVAEKDETIDLPFLETENGFLLGWEDPSGVIHDTTYIVKENVTLTPVFESFNDVLELEFNEEEKVVSILNYNGHASRVKIPHTIDDYIVRFIGIEAFSETNPVRVDIPLTVYNIGMKSFSNMPNLKEVHYYGEYLGTVESVINKDVFDEIIESHEVCQSTNMDEDPTETNPWIFETGCPITKVTEKTDPINGPDGNVYFSYHVEQPASEAPIMSLNQRIGITPFIGSEQLTTITLPDKYSFFESEIFEGIPNLETVYIENNPFIYSDNGVIYDKETESLLYYPSGLLTEDFVIPNHINHISTWAFFGSKTQTITIHDSLSFDEGAFAYLTGLKDIMVEEENPYYTVHDGIVYSKDESTLLAYPAGKDATTHTIIPSVTIIDDLAFMNQQYLENIIISEGVQTISDNAFIYLKSLVTADIASTVDFIFAGNFFQREGTLETFIIRNETNVIHAPAINIKMTEALEIYIPDELMIDYEEDMWWQQYADYFVPLSELDE
ncbi:MAG: leucine-rich repeat protein [Candidatus Izemoplasmataceae bacterium]